MTTHAKEPGATPKPWGDATKKLEAAILRPPLASKEWFKESAEIEGDSCVSAGIPAMFRDPAKPENKEDAQRMMLENYQSTIEMLQRELTALRATAEQLARALAETLPTVRLVLREMRSMNDERSLNLTNKVATAEDALTAARELKLLP